MSNRVFIGLLAIIAIGFLYFGFIGKEPAPKVATLGVEQKEQGSNHIARGQQHAPYNTDPASSGPHYADEGAPTPWGVYTTEVPEEVFVHNEEHGGVIVTYNPRLLAADKVKRLQALFAPPYSNPKFSPTKAIVTPRTKNKYAIQVVSWRWTLDLEKYDESKLKSFYLQRVSKSPEPTAGPTNTPINQAIDQ